MRRAVGFPPRGGKKRGGVSALYRRSVFVFGILAIMLGFGILVRTAYDGGGTFGYAFGALFVALGAARLYILRKT